MNKTFPVPTVAIMTVRSLSSVSGVVAVEMEMINGVPKGLMESVSPEVTRLGIYCQTVV